VSEGKTTKDLAVIFERVDAQFGLWRSNPVAELAIRVNQDCARLTIMASGTVDTTTSYERGRGKPRPSRNHGIVQANLITEFALQRQYRVLSELSLELEGRPFSRFPALRCPPHRPAIGGCGDSFSHAGLSGIDGVVAGGWKVIG